MIYDNQSQADTQQRTALLEPWMEEWTRMES